MSRRDIAEERWAVVVANGMRREDVGAWLEALVGPDHCRHCDAELPRMPGPGRPRAWCEAHRTAIGRRPAGRVCPGCGVSLDGRRRQTIVCGERCRSRIRRQTRRA